MNIPHNGVLRQKLAAEYALGTLRGGARRRFEAWMSRDGELRMLATEWKARLGPMAEFSESVKPPKSVWRGIERNLHLKRPAPSWQFWLNENLLFWRNLGMVSTALAALLLVVVLGKTMDVPAITYVAALSDEQAHTVLVLTADSRHRALDVHMVTPAHFGAESSLQLWAVPKAGTPRSLGLLSGDSTRLRLSEIATSADVALLAVSLEPKGGSPDPNGPTGPILYKGEWVRL